MRSKETSPEKGLKLEHSPFLFVWLEKNLDYHFIKLIEFAKHKKQKRSGILRQEQFSEEER